MSLIENKENIDYQIIKRNNIKYYIHSLITVGFNDCFLFYSTYKYDYSSRNEGLCVFLCLFNGGCFVEMLCRVSWD